MRAVVPTLGSSERWSARHEIAPPVPRGPSVEFFPDERRLEDLRRYWETHRQVWEVRESSPEEALTLGRLHVLWPDNFPSPSAIESLVQAIETRAGTPPIGLELVAGRSLLLGPDVNLTLKAWKYLHHESIHHPYTRCHARFISYVRHGRRMTSFDQVMREELAVLVNDRATVRQRPDDLDAICDYTRRLVDFRVLFPADVALTQEDADLVMTCQEMVNRSVLPVERRTELWFNVAVIAAGGLEVVDGQWRLGATQPRPLVHAAAPPRRRVVRGPEKSTGGVA